MHQKTDDTRDQDVASSETGTRQAHPHAVDSGSAREPATIRPSADARTRSYDKVDDASDDSFPASDAPAWTGMSVG